MKIYIVEFTTKAKDGETTKEKFTDDDLNNYIGETVLGKVESLYESFNTYISDEHKRNVVSITEYTAKNIFGRIANDIKWEC